MSEDENPSGRPNKFRGKRGPERSAGRQAAEAAGMSRHQFYQAMKIAEIPDDEFDAMVESDSPPTITALASHSATPKPRATACANAAAAIAKAIDAAHAAYWTACDDEGLAIDPAELDAPQGLLDDAHDAALMVETLAQERSISWAEARELV